MTERLATKMRVIQALKRARKLNDPEIIVLLEDAIELLNEDIKKDGPDRTGTDKQSML